MITFINLLQNFNVQFTKVSIFKNDFVANLNQIFVNLKNNSKFDISLFEIFS